METSKNHENYPKWIVLLSNLVSLAIFALGFFILMRLSIIASFAYLLFVLVQEYRLISKHCVNCYYWGKTCGFGQGRVSAIFFKKGDTSKFCEKDITWKDLIPDLLISLIPIVVGIVLLIVKFDINILIAIVLLAFLSTSANGFVRGQLTCKYCKQRELGCPAEKLFNKK